MERKSEGYAKYAELFTLCETDVRTCQPYVCAKVNGQIRLALFDSGSTINAVSETVARTADPHHDTFDCDFPATGASGEFKITKKVKLLTQVGNGTFEVMFAVIPNLPVEVLFGTPFMGRAKVALDIADNSYSIGGERFPFLNRNEPDQRRESSQSLVVSQTDKIQFDLQTDFPKEEKELRSLLREFSDIFGTEARIANGVAPVRVETRDAKPIAQKVRLMNPAKAELLRTWANEQLAAGLVEDSNSEWGHNVLFVPKKNGTLRPCVDYRPVNTVTEKDAYPVPNVGELLNRIGRSAVFSMFDMAKGFNHLLIHPKDRHKLAFYADGKLLQPVVMPFGMKNAPAAFQRAMNMIFYPLLNICVIVYVDDIAVHSLNPGAHLSDLRKFFEICRASNLTLNVEKTQLMRKRIKLLGHVIEQDRVEPDPEKVAAMQNFPEPTDASGIRKFLGTVGYYRTFIPKFSLIAKPLSCLTSERVPFKWTQLERNSFKQLRDAVLDKVLKVPDMSGDFLIQCDASGVGLGAVLMNRSKVTPATGEKPGKYLPVSFISRALQGAEKNYSTTELECLAIVWAIEKFRPYVELTPFVIETDHIALKWLMAMKNPKGRIARWIMKLQEWDFTINHRPGKANQLADGLSRFPQPAKALALLALDNQDWVEVITLIPSQEIVDREFWTTFPTIPEFERTRLIDAQKADKFLSDVRAYLNGDLLKDKSANWRVTVQTVADKSVETSDGLIVTYDNPQNCDILEDEYHFERAYLPESMYESCVTFFHDSPLSGHLGFDKTYDQIQRRFYWIGMYKYIHNYVSSCELCQKHKYRNRKPYGTLYTPRVRMPFEKVAVDLIGPMPKSTHGHAYALVLVDTCTGWPEVIPLRSAQVTARKCVEGALQIFCRYGFPRLIISDNGPQFASALWTGVMKMMSVRTVFTTPYHPQANPTERRNRDIKSYIRKFCEEKHALWDEHINEMLYVLRTTRLKSTKLTPAMMLFGRELAGPVDILTSPPGDTGTEFEPNRYLDQIGLRLRNAVKYGIENKELAHRIGKIQYDKHRTDYEFVVGDLVLLDEHPLSKKAIGFAAGLAPQRDGPYRIIARENRLNYRLEYIGNTKTKGEIVWAHIAQMTKYIERSEDLLNGTKQRSENSETAIPANNLGKGTPGLGKKRGRKPGKTGKTVIPAELQPVSNEEEQSGIRPVTRAQAKKLATRSKLNEVVQASSGIDGIATTAPPGGTGENSPAKPIGAK